MTHTISPLAAQGKAVAQLLPQAGGRVTSLQLRSPRGGVIEVLHPCPEGLFDPVR